MFQELNEIQPFIAEKHPSFLSTIKHYEDHVLLLWQQQGMPGHQESATTQELQMGEAFAWIEGEYTNWLQGQEYGKPETRIELESVLHQMELMGDILPQEAGGVLPVTPKGLARNLVLWVSWLVNIADEEQRGLRSEEAFALEHTLGLALKQLREYNRERGGKHEGATNI